MLSAACFLMNLLLVLVFLKAAFTVEKLNDILSLDKMTSKELCPIPNLLFTTVIMISMGFALFWVSYSFHVFPTYYA